MLDPDAAALAADGADRLVEAHARLDLRVERMGDAIHAADRLQHGRLHVDDRFEDLREGGAAAGQDFLERQRIERLARIVIAARPVGKPKLLGLPPWARPCR
jgi:hypothetical protein